MKLPQYRRPGARLSEEGGEALTAVLCVLAAALAVMVFTGYWPFRPNEYNSYTLQACAWLDGHLDLGRNYDWLEIAQYNGKYYVSFPPFPSYVMLMFALFLGSATPDAAIALLVTAVGVAYATRLYRRVRGDGQGLFWVLFLYLGTGYLFIAVNGYVWFIAQTMCFTLSLMALYYALLGKGGLSLTFWACAVGCRPMVLLYCPVLLWLLWRRYRGTASLWRLIRNRWYWCLGPLLLGGSYMLLNFLRFGNVLEFGHNYLPEFLEAPEGQFSLSYFWGNFAKLFRLPGWNGVDEPLSFYTANGMAVWLINPLLLSIAAAWLFALRRRRREEPFLWGALPVLTAGYVFILCCHRTLGGWHFGCRYLLDVMPWLFFGLALWKPAGERFRRYSLPLFCFGAGLNLIGTVAVYNDWLPVIG